MAYSTGTYTDPNDALDQFAAFAAANGWTENRNTMTDGQRRVHIQKTINALDCCFSFKVMLGGAPFPDFASVYGIALQGSTSYASGLSWNDQPGHTVKKYTDSDTAGGVVDNLKELGGRYHFFAQSTALHAVFETDSTYSDFRMFTVGEVGGGIYFAASGGWDDNYSDSQCRRSMYRSAYASNYAAGIYDGTRWRTSYGYAIDGEYELLNSVRSGFADYSNCSLASPLVTYSPDGFRGNAVLAPDHVMTTGDEITKAEPFGEVEGVKFINMTNYSNEEEIVVGTDTYMLFRQQNRASSFPIGVALLK